MKKILLSLVLPLAVFVGVVSFFAPSTAQASPAPTVEWKVLNKSITTRKGFWFFYPDTITGVFSLKGKVVSGPILKPKSSDFTVFSEDTMKSLSVQIQSGGVSALVSPNSNYFNEGQEFVVNVSAVIAANDKRLCKGASSMLMTITGIKIYGDGGSFSIQNSDLEDMKTSEVSYTGTNSRVCDSDVEYSTPSPSITPTVSTSNNSNNKPVLMNTNSNNTNTNVVPPPPPENTLTNTEVTNLQYGGGSANTNSCFYFTKNLKINDANSDVIALQTWLIENGYKISNITDSGIAKGSFGEQTKRALQAYQLANGINEEGVFGPLTRAKVNASCGLTGSPLITVLSPNGGETWNYNGNNTITWNYSGLYATDEVQIGFRNSDGTMCWSEKVNAGLKQISVNPSLIRCTTNEMLKVGRYKVQLNVTKYNQSSVVSDMSNGFFVLLYPVTQSTPPDTTTVSTPPAPPAPPAPAQPAITLITPNGGEGYAIGDTVPIRWSTTGLTSQDRVSIMLIDYSTTPSTPISLNTTITATQGQYNWVIPATASVSSMYKISLITIPQLKAMDVSNYYFSVRASAVKPTITITSPVSGNTFKADTNHTVTWNSTVTDHSYYRLMLKNGNSGSAAYMLEDNISKTATSYSTLFSTSKINSLASSAGMTASAIQDKYYVELYAMKPFGANNTMTYEVVGKSGYFTIELNTNESLPPPPAPPEPTITLTTPNGGEGYVIGDMVPIRWIATGFSDTDRVYIMLSDYSTPTPTTYSLNTGIILAKTGQFNWTITADTKVASMYKISVYTMNPQYIDSSNYYFSIRANVQKPSITITSPSAGSIFNADSVQTVRWTSTVTDHSYYRMSLKNSNAGSVAYMLGNNIDRTATSHNASLTSSKISSLALSSGKTAEQIKDGYYIELYAMKPFGADNSMTYEVLGKSGYFTINPPTTEPPVVFGGTSLTAIIFNAVSNYFFGNQE